MRRAIGLHRAVVGWLLVAACSATEGPTVTGPTVSSAPPPSASAASSASARAAAEPSRFTLLYTADEHGWLLPGNDGGKTVGGAAEVLGRWVAEEGHCVGGDACPDPVTLALSGGDNWTGPAVSSYFHGVPMAEAMRRMGYAVSAFGNHEFDFGRERFLKNGIIGGFPYVAANLHVVAGGPDDFRLPPFVTFKRKGATIAVVGLATDTTLKVAMASRFVGIEFEPEEAALGRAIPEAWATGPDAVVLLAHECPDKLVPILERHPEWALAFVGAGHCHKTIETKVFGRPVVAPGWRLRQYARVALTVDRTRPQKERVVDIDARVVQVTREEGKTSPAPEPVLAAHAEKARRETDAVLGDVVGFSASGFEQKSQPLGRYVAGAWRAELRTDLAIVNSGGLRQSIPKGEITRNLIYSVLPFDNRILVVRIKGSALLENLALEEAIVAGARDKGGGNWVFDDGRPIDRDATYSVATVDFLYFGGAGFTFQKHDPHARETGLDWREPVVAWTKKQRSSAQQPLEKKLR